MCKPLLQEVSKNEYISKAHCVARFNLCSKRFTWKSNSNQIKIKSILFKLDSVRSGCPISRARGSCIKRSSFRIELEFRNVGFCGEGKTGVPGEKPLGAEKRTNNKLNPHMTSSPGIEPGPHWWKASALTTAPSLLPRKKYLAARNTLARSFFLAPKYIQAPSYTG